ncbi:hypothetical protein Tco_0692607 [Tanacetum coccineum]
MTSPTFLWCYPWNCLCQKKNPTKCPLNPYPTSSNSLSPPFSILPCRQIHKLSLEPLWVLVVKLSPISQQEPRCGQIQPHCEEADRLGNVHPYGTPDMEIYGMKCQRWSNAPSKAHSLESGDSETRCGDWVIEVVNGQNLSTTALVEGIGS